MSKKLAVGARKQKAKGTTTPKRVLAGAGKQIVTATRKTDGNTGRRGTRQTS